MPNLSAYTISKFTSAQMLPIQWDELAASIFQKRFFLQHTEKYNPCNQRYYILSDKRGYVAAACVYTLGIHLLTFRNIPSRITMQVIGLPISVSAPGLFGKNYSDTEALLRHLLEIEKGLILGLNFTPGMNSGKAVSMRMLPTIIMDISFNNWNEYLQILKSRYRRRTKRIRENFRDVTETKTSCTAFTETHHQLYRQVIEHSGNKLEELSYEYFQNLPAPFQLTSYHHNDRLICWHINCHQGDTLYFFFGGHDYQLLGTYQSYFNNLFGIIQEAISEGFRQIELGQTAESAKLKAGGEIHQKMLFLYCRNRLLRFLIRIARPLIAYHYPKTQFHALLETTTYDQSNKNANPVCTTSAAS